MEKQSLLTIIKAIVSGQHSIIGPIAISEANKVSGLTISADLNSITVNGDSIDVLTKLVHQYERLFGQASIEACKDSIRGVLSQVSSKDIPDFLR